MSSSSDPPNTRSRSKSASPIKPPQGRGAKGKAKPKKKKRPAGGVTRWLFPAVVGLLLITGGVLLAVKLVGRTSPAPEEDQTATLQPTPGGDSGGTTIQPVSATGDSGNQRWSFYDPRNDGWDTEVFSEVAGRQLTQLAKQMESPARLTDADLADMFNAGFTCDSLRPQETTTTTIDDSSISVERGAISSPVAPGGTGSRYSGLEGAIAALREALGPLANAEDVHCKFKLFHVTPREDFTETTQYFSASGRVGGKTVEQTSTWIMHWTADPGQELPRLKWIGASAFEQVTAELPQEHLYADYTQAVLGQTQAYQQQLAHDIDYWRARIERELGIEYDAQHGVAVADVNGDGLDDVYISQPGGLPNRLMVQQLDGTVRDMSLASGTDVMNFTQSSLFLDLDNDGDQDLVVSTHQGVFFLANDGRGNFQLKTIIDNVMAAYSMAAADYDQDGDLDVYFCQYNGEGDDPSVFPTPVPYQDANNGGHNHLLRNEGDWRFVDATEETGLDQNNSRFSFAAAWEDYDQDGDEDLYVANDFGRNNLYRNDDGHFSDVAAEAGLEDGAFGMSVSWGDFDLDGDMDLYVGNMFSAAGNRVTYQHRFKPGESEETVQQLRRLARGNSLFENQGDGTFIDISVEAGVTMGRWSWASLFSDINNDGWEDLLVANGYFTSTRPDDL